MMAACLAHATLGSDPREELRAGLRAGPAMARTGASPAPSCFNRPLCWSSARVKQSTAVTCDDDEASS